VVESDKILFFGYSFGSLKFMLFDSSFLQIMPKWSLRFAFSVVCILTLVRYLLISSRFNDFLNCLADLASTSLRPFSAVRMDLTRSMETADARRSFVVVTCGSNVEIP